MDGSTEVNRCTQEAFASAEREWFAAVEATLNQTASSTTIAADERQQPRRWVQLRSEDTFQRCELASIVQVIEGCRRPCAFSAGVAVTAPPPPNSLSPTLFRHPPRFSLATAGECCGGRSERRRRFRCGCEPFRLR